MKLAMPMCNVRDKQCMLENKEEEIYLNGIDRGLGTSVVKIPRRLCFAAQIILKLLRIPSENK